MYQLLTFGHGVALPELGRSDARVEWSYGDLGALGEFVGSAAVLITLIYLALQVRQTNENAQATVEARLR